MTPRIRKKDKDRKGNQRFVLEWEKDGKTINWTFTAPKLLDWLKKSKFIKEENNKS